MDLIEQLREGLVVIRRVGLGHVAWQQHGHVMVVVVPRCEDARVDGFVCHAIEPRRTQEVREGLALGSGEGGRGEDEAAGLRVEVGG